ncbi:MAG: 2Fe-2S iron-sulfur cluster-binding protein, partial [Firmicutes bacterium]|nr:2Fe-2S iron-sulfur cluster-binding protein [Bacillota bacterium]
MAECNVVFFPEGKTVKVNKGQTLLEAAQAAGIYVHSICAGDGICGKCKVIVREGSVSTVPTSLLTREEIQRSYVLACQTTVNSDVEIEVPPESRLEEVQILTETERKKRLVGLFGEAEEVESQEKLEKKLKFSVSPLARKVYLELPEPSLDDSLSDLQRIYRELKRKENFPVMQTGLANIRKISSILRASGWKVTVTLGRRNGTL